MLQSSPITLESFIDQKAQTGIPCRNYTIDISLLNEAII